MIKKTRRPSESIPRPNPSMKIGPNELKTSCGPGSYLSHSTKVGISHMIMINKTARRIIGKKLRIPINSFELRDIKYDLRKVSSILFGGQPIAKLFLVH
jgi:hypothetical protein